jgi:MFS family permease
MRGRGRILLILAVIGVAALQLIRIIGAERALTGGEISLPLDDSFIYLQYSRAIAEGHPFVYTPGNAPTTGATSLWYPFVLLPPHLLHLPPAVCVGWSIAVGVAAFVLSALLLAGLGRRLGGRLGAALALLLFLVSPYLLWGYLSGMEIGLYATLLMCTLTAYLAERSAARFPTMRWWLFGLAGSRPEGAVLCFVFGLLMAWDRLRESRGPDRHRFVSRSLLLPFAAAALPFLVNLAISGSIESSSSQAKSILAEPYAETRAEYLAHTPTIWWNIAQCYLSQLMLDGGRPLPPIWIPSAIGALLFAVFAFVPRRSPWNGGAALFGLVAVGIVVNSLPVYWQVHFYRYQQGLFPVVLLVFAAGWGRLAWWAWERLPRWFGAPLAAAAAIGPLFFWMQVLVPANSEMIGVYARTCENIFHQQVRVGHWIDATLPKDAIVGLNDAGAIAYYGRRSTVDFVGLTTAGLAPVYRSGLGCLFEDLRRLPPGRLPTHCAIYPEWFPYWQDSGILGPEQFRAHLDLNVICGGTDMVVSSASWNGVAPSRDPVRMDAELTSLRQVDSVDLAWLADERKHEWRADPEAKDVLRRYGYADAPARTVTDGGRIVRRENRFRASVAPGKDVVLVMRTDAWYSNRLRVLVDGRPAGEWAYAFSETAWVEPRFRVRGDLVTRARPEFRILRDEAGGDLGGAAARDFSPFRYWVYQ